MLRRRYVAGNHKFGVGSILSEPERHRDWRKRHAKTEVENRRRSNMRRIARRMGLNIEICRKRRPDAEGFGTYQIVDSLAGVVVAAGKSGQYGLTLKKCENLLNKWSDPVVETSEARIVKTK
jgi:hypothetical protein